MEGVDALVTNVPDVCVAVSTADCVPVLLYAPDRKVVAAVHAGWRGTVLHIARKAASLMIEAYDCDPAQLVAGIGPSISQAAFEVGEEVVKAFQMAGFPMERILRRNAETQKAHIDLWETNRLQLLEAGLLSEHIEIAGICTYIHVLAIACQVKNTEPDERLWEEITRVEEDIRSTCKIEDINKWTPIFATRQAYKRLGKDPNRYRPSAEALRRRILRGLPLYKIDTLVDIINLVSIRSGYSIGGFDADKIVGGLELGVGKEGEIYHGIGRGELNIAGLPVYRDGVAGVGTPTSDEERTKIEMSTTSLLMILNGYSGKEGLLEAGGYSVDLLKRYVSAVNVEAELICRENRGKITL